jgi:hypothetical protein
MVEIKILLYFCSAIKGIRDMESMYDLDIAIEILARMQAIKTAELNSAVDRLQRANLQREINILRTEEKALYSNNPLQQSVIDKAFRLYGPVLKINSEPCNDLKQNVSLKGKKNMS